MHSIRTTPIARWKARGQFCIVIIEFCRYLSRLRRSMRKSVDVEVGIFRRGGPLSANIAGGRGQFPVTSVGVERLEISRFVWC